jgi:predicted DNA-binding transcriptional regulator AlpA
MCDPQLSADGGIEDRMSVLPRKHNSSNDTLFNPYAAAKAGLDGERDCIFLDEAEQDRVQEPVRAKSEKTSTEEKPRVGSPQVSLELASPGPYLSDKQVAQRYSVKKQTIWRWAKKSATFPKPKKFQGTTTRWCLAELIEYERKEMEACK